MGVAEEDAEAMAEVALPARPKGVAEVKAKRGARA